MLIETSLSIARSGDYPTFSEINALKHIFQNSGVADTLDQCACSKTGLIYPGSGLFAKNQDGTFDSNAGIQAVTGLTPIGTGFPLIVIAGRNNSATTALRFVVGNIASGNGGIRTQALTGGTGQCTFHDGTIVIDSSTNFTINNGSDYSLATIGHRGNVLKSACYSPTAKIGSTVSASNIDAGTDIVTEQQLNITGRNIYCAAYFLFDAYPDNWEQIACEMAAIWRLGYTDYMPPEWAYL